MFNYKQFILWKAVPDGTKVNKLPVSPHTGIVSDAHNPANWASYDEARQAADRFGCGVAFVFTEADPFFFIDLDNQLQADGTWSELAIKVCNLFAGCAVEVSQSGRGLHIFGTGKAAQRSYKRADIGLEVYTSKRFVALTSIVRGEARCSAQFELDSLLGEYFASNDGHKLSEEPGEWTEGPCAEWSGPDDDEELIRRLMASKSSGIAKRATVQELWEGDPTVMAKYYPDSGREYDANRADAALCAHLAFWTGKDCERMDRLMRMSGLARDKWLDRSDYRVRTILRAVGGCREVYRQRVEAVASTAQAVGGFMGVGEQLEHFDGCVYIRDMDRVFVPDGAQLKASQFKAMYGGHTFAMDAVNGKVTTDAWKVFTESQAHRFAKAQTIRFRPAEEPGSIRSEGGVTTVNTYVPVVTPRRKGDAGPFVGHIAKLFPDESDRAIIIAYMAAVVQFPGVKFQWCPLIQGCEGNGKTLLIRCLVEAVGQKYCHLPDSRDLGNKFNAWILNKVFVGVEEVFLPDQREIHESLKVLVTNDRMGIQQKGLDQFTGDNRANFFMCSNHKDGIRKSQLDRRFAVMYTAQQHGGDMERDGMNGNYFPRLYDWLNSGGYAIVNDYLRSYSIPESLNPAGACHRAPTTSSTVEAIGLSLGPIEQDILEAVDSERPGFKGGWLSSHAFSNLLGHSGRKLTHSKRNELLYAMGFVRHPGLNGGRVGATVAAEGGGRPILYIKKGHTCANLTDNEDIFKEYLAAQGYGA
jgi:primase-polymerase (primpol)-like protein